MTSYLYWSPDKQSWEVTFDKEVSEAHVPKNDYKKVYATLIALLLLVLVLLYVNEQYKSPPIPPDYRF